MDRPVLRSQQQARARSLPIRHEIRILFAEGNPLLRLSVITSPKLVLSNFLLEQCRPDVNRHNAVIDKLTVNHDRDVVCVCGKEVEFKNIKIIKNLIKTLCKLP